MKKNLMRAVAALLCAAMVIPFASCGKKAPAKTVNKDAIYREELKSLNFVEGFQADNFTYSDGYLYFQGYLYDEKTYSSTTMIEITDIDGNSIGEYVLSDNSWINRVAKAPGGNAYVCFSEYNAGGEMTTFYSGGAVGSSLEKEDEDNETEDDTEMPEIPDSETGGSATSVADTVDDTVDILPDDGEDYYYEEKYYIAVIDKTGKELSRVCTSDTTDIMYLDGIIPTDDGLIVYSGTTFAKFDRDLKLVKETTLEGDFWINEVFSDKTGKVYVSYWGSEKVIVKPFDTNTLTLGDESTIPVSLSMYTIYDGAGGYDLFLKNNTSLYGYNLGDADKTEVINFIDSDIAASYFNAFVPLEDGTFLGFYTEYVSGKDNYEGTYKGYLARYTKVDPSDVVEKKVLTLGCIYLDGDVRKRVVDFNKSNPEYRISIIEYNTFNTEEDYSAGYNKLNSDIAAGQVPDIILSNDPSLISNYASKGLFLDLYKYLDNDPEIDKNDIFPNLLKACEYDGKLYQIAPYFNVSTVLAKKKFVGDRTSWTFEEMKKFEEGLPEGTLLFAGSTRDEILSQCLAMDASYYVDMGKAKCNFDSDAFKSLLIYVKNLPEATDDYYEKLYNSGFFDSYETMYREDRVVLYNEYLSDPTSYIRDVYGYMGEECVFIGYPTMEGNGSMLSFYNSSSISSKCAAPEVAWDFVKYYLTPEYQDTISWQIPASMSKYDEICKEAMKMPTYTDYETGEEIENPPTFWMNGQEIPLPLLTQADADKLKSFILSVDKLQCTLSDDILNIITEEAAPFFEGQKSVDDVASLIQSRVSIYINEKQ